MIISQNFLRTSFLKKLLKRCPVSKEGNSCKNVYRNTIHSQLKLQENIMLRNLFLCPDILKLSKPNILKFGKFQNRIPPEKYARETKNCSWKDKRKSICVFGQKS